MATVSIDHPIIIEGEANNQLVFTVSLSKPYSEKVTLKYITSNDSATAGQDYTSVSSGTIEFLPNQTVQTISIPIINDSISEQDETFFVNVYLPKSTVINPSTTDIFAATGIGTISDTSSANSNTTSTTIENIILKEGGGNLNATGNSLNNTLTGNSGNNILDGGSGNDTIFGRGGDDSILGGVGHDSLNGEAGKDIIKGGTDNDIYIIDSTDTIEETINAGTDTVQANFDYSLLDNFENLTLTESAIKGSGNKLNNYLTGNKNNNTLDGLDGSDTIDGGLGNDTVSGGMGDDYYILAGTDVVKEVVDAGVDTVETNATYTIASQPNLENVVLTGDANLKGTGNNASNRIIGNSGNNIIDSKEGNDLVNGQAGNDSITGASGDDTLSGGYGSDTLVGQEGSDTYLVDNVGDKVNETSVDLNYVDTVLSSINYTLGTNLDNLTLLGLDNLTGTGNSLNNSINGNSGNNLLDSKNGDDLVNGGKGDDTLFGREANDTLVGGDGVDRFNYNTGTAYSGADLGADRILDFTVSQDKIVLGKTTYGLKSIVGNSFSITTEFESVATDDLAKGSQGRIAYSRGTGNLFYNPNGATIGGESVLTTLDKPAIPNSMFPDLSGSDFIIEA